jgi:hypothetical protein
MNDPIVDEIRRIRDAHAAKFGYDLDAIFEDIKEQEKKSGLKFVSYAQRRPDEVDAKLPSPKKLRSLMASPFPGMDPYLEGARWPGFHHDLATEIKRQLTPLLLPGYYADTSTYFLVDTGDDLEIARKFYLDVGVKEQADRTTPYRPVAISDAPVLSKLVLPHCRPHSQVEIREMRNDRLVTAIEFLSPPSKRTPGRKQYLRKRLRILRSDVHLIELDLLRRGRRLPWSGDPPPASYYVYLSRADRRSEIGIWPLALADRLPVIPVPLLNGDSDVPLDLQQAVNAVYASSRYDLLLNYTEAPDVPLNSSDVAWVDQVLKEKGIRPR